ncbi:MAG TPA: hypothetical protein VLX68_13520 [Chitinivibrionales bacterium]|nr:hypothetical protein [Chitinivibrionales bacterium]
MNTWTDSLAQKHVYNFSAFSAAQKKNLLDELNRRFPPPVYREHRRRQLAAIKNAEERKKIVSGAKQRFPPVINAADLNAAPSDLAGYAVVLTAGGDGERLRASLRGRGASDADLKDFTKATFQLPGFPKGFGSLQANLAVIAGLCRRGGLDIPVIVTTGPASSENARIISGVIAARNNYGIKYLAALAQDERLHLTPDGMVAVDGDKARPATNPDETGGPFMKLAQPGFSGMLSALDWLSGLGCKKIIALQATALYDPAVVLAMAAAGKQHDCMGVGILRTKFDKTDQYGAFVNLEKNGTCSLVIIEQAVRNNETMKVRDKTGKLFLPFNTGLYVFDVALLSKSGLPDYATPPKEVLPGLPKSPKIGYAATDLMSCAKHGAVLSIEPDSYAVIKTADDLELLSALAKRCGIIDLCTSRIK